MNPYRTFHESYTSLDNDTSTTGSIAPVRSLSQRAMEPQSVTTTTTTNPNPIVFDIRSNEELAKIVQDFPIVVVDVWAPYCNPCRMLMPKYEKIARKYERAFHDRLLIFVKDNIEQNIDIHKPHVRVVPTFFVYVHGQRYHISTFSEIEPTVESALNDVLSSRT